MTSSWNNSAAVSRSCSGYSMTLAGCPGNRAPSSFVAKPTLPAWTSWCGPLKTSKVIDWEQCVGMVCTSHVSLFHTDVCFSLQELRICAPNCQRSSSPKPPVKSSSLTCPCSSAAFRYNHRPGKVHPHQMIKKKDGIDDRNNII